MPPSDAAARPRGAHLTWHDLSISVPVTTPALFGLLSRPTSRSKSILSRSHGFARPGTVTMIMGPSGSGKTTLLDTLANRMARAPADGGACVDGVPRDHVPRAEFSRRAKFVPQDDRFYTALTAKETLVAAARLYAPEGAAGRSPEESAEEVMELLGLTEQAHVRVGGLFVRGLSGGQRRRLSVGIELMAHPEMLLLDEPTTGLDSAAAMDVLRILRHVADSSNTTILLVIHQPSRELLELSDNLLVLARGRTAYFGPTAKAVPYFEALGTPIEQGQSASEFMLDLVNSDFRPPQEVDKILDAWDQSPLHDQLVADVADCDAQRSDRAPRAPRSGPGVWLSQFATLLQRGFREAWRQPTIAWPRFLLYTILSLVIGTVWLRVGRTSDNVYQFMTASGYLMAFYTFMSVAVIPYYLEEKQVTLREYSNGEYYASSFVAAHTVAMLPFLAVMTLIVVPIAYWLVNLRPGAGPFFIFTLTIFAILAAAESVVYLLSLLFNHYIITIGATASLFAVGMALMGGMIRERNITWVVRWLRYPSLQYWGLVALHTSQYRGEFFPPPDDAPPGTDGLEGDFVLQVFSMDNFSPWHGIGFLLASIVVIRILCVLVLRYVLTGKR